jgi:hypothetical protein
MMGGRGVYQRIGSSTPPPVPISNDIESPVPDTSKDIQGNEPSTRTVCAVRVLVATLGLTDLAIAIALFVLQLGTNKPVTTIVSHFSSFVNTPVTPLQQVNTTNFPVGWISGTYLTISAIYLFWATFRVPVVYRTKKNVARWVSDLIIFPLVMFQLALVVGVVDPHLLLSVGILSFAFIGLGASSAFYNNARWGTPEKKDNSGFWLALIVWLTAWAILSCYFGYGTQKYGGNHNVSDAYSLTLFFQVVYGVVYYMKQKEWWRFKSYAFSDAALILTGFAMRQALSWSQYVLYN